jgi:DNA-binding winged helix-turn-helix (wHTH) protein/tetratricopeptide (TPR) repeat protein
MSMQTIYHFGSFRLDCRERQLFRHNEVIPLQEQAYKTLALLVERGGRVIERNEFFQIVWPNTVVEDGSLTVIISQLRRVLGDDRKAPKFIETISGRGYRFMAPVREEVAAAVEDTVSTEDEINPTSEPITPPPESLPSPPTESANKRAFQFSRRMFAVVAAIVVLLGLGIGYVTWSKRPYTIAVRSFRNLGNEAQINSVGVDLSERIAREFINAPCKDLSFVSSDTRVADYEVEGSYGKRAGKWKITVRVKNVKSGGFFWQEDFHAPEPYKKALLDKVARNVLLNACSQKAAPKREIVLAAYNLFSQGVDKYRIEDFVGAAALFEKCVAIDSQYAAAWTYLGSTYVHLASSRLKGEIYYQKAQAAYEKAMALNSDELRPRIQLSMMLTETNRAEKAIELLKEVLSRHPESAEAQWELGYAYRYAGLLEESLELSNRAMASDPGFHDLYSFSIAQLYLGDYRGLLGDEEISKDNAYLTFYRGFAHYHLKEFSQAKAAFDHAFKLAPQLLQARIGKALSYGLDKRTQDGLAILAETEQIINKGGNTDPEGLYRLAQGYAVLGNKTAALDALRRSVEGGFFCYPYLRDDPLLMNLRGEPRLQPLLEAAKQRHDAVKRQFVN